MKNRVPREKAALVRVLKRHRNVCTKAGKERTRRPKECHLKVTDKQEPYSFETRLHKCTVTRGALSFPDVVRTRVA